MFVVTEDMEIVDCNDAASRMLDTEPQRFLRMRGGEVLDCIHSREDPGGCGRSDACRHCVLRSTVGEASGGGKAVRRRARLDLVNGATRTPLHLLVTASPIEMGEETLYLLILEDIQELTELRSILPMCASCHKIRDDEDFWASVESYFKDRLDLDFSHGLCPDCIKELYPDFDLKAE
jgi:hypothetical protein